MQNLKAIDNDEITKKVWSLIDALPQREAILESDAKSWVNEMVPKYGDLAIWHAIRAGGFGGSQIGALVRNFMGQRADHDQSAHDIVAGSLLRKLPDNPSGPMRRGIAMEPQHRRWFHEKYDAIQDKLGFDALSKCVGRSPWMRYSPDDLVYMPSTVAAQNRKRVLVDYKAPGEVDDADKIAFQYVCQLHMGRLVCESNNIQIDEMILSQFDWANWKIKEDKVDHVEELDGLILQAGDHYWDYVMNGNIPPYVRKERLPDEEQVRSKIGEDSLKMARLKALVNAAEKQITKFEDYIKPEIGQFTFGGAKLQLEGIGYTASPKFDKEEVAKILPLDVLESIPLQKRSSTAYDTDAMVTALKALNVDMKAFIKPGNLNVDVLYDTLLAHGADVDSLITEQLTGRVDKKLVSDVSAWFEREFSELMFVKKPEPELVDIEFVDESTDETDGREGQGMLRQVPRLLSE